MSKWGRVENELWEKSETLKELEKYYQNVAKKLALAAEEYRKAQEQVSQKVKEIKTDADSAQKSVNTLVEKAKNLADDSESEEKKNIDLEHEQAKQALLEELELLATKAGLAANHKLAYMIERKIDELKEE